MEPLNIGVINCGILTLENVGSAVNYCSNFITFAAGQSFQVTASAVSVCIHAMHSFCHFIN